jgi:hypothetical protein
MTDREREISGKIKGYLDQGAKDLRPGVAYRLQLARTAALARLDQPKTATVPSYAPAFLHGGGTLGGPARPWYASARLWIGIALIAAFGFGAQQWRLYQQATELADLDTQILTSDLPIDAYLDRGFQNWLKTSDND